MTFDYFLQLDGNPLYAGNHLINNRYQTYGQLAFVADFLNSLVMSKHDVRLVIIGNSETLTEPKLFNEAIKVSYLFSVDEQIFIRENTNIILDVIEDAYIEHVPKESAIGIIHYSKYIYSEAYIEKCYKLICMSEIAHKKQKTRIPEEKLVTINHGIDLNRYIPRNYESEQNDDKGNIKILLSGRLEGVRGDKLNEVISLIVKDYKPNYEINVLGTGILYEKILKYYGDRVTLLSNVNQLRMPIFLKNYDLIIGSGRISMESLALGIPTLICGVEYSGIVQNSNIEILKESNMTGEDVKADLINIHEDIELAIKTEPKNLIALANKYFNMDNFVIKFLETLSQQKSETVKTNKLIKIFQHHKNRLELCRDYLSTLQYESNLISQRMAWFVTAQSFLFIAFVNSIAPNALKSSLVGAEKSFYWPYIPVMGVLISTITIFFVWFGLKALKKQRTKLSNFLENYQNDPTLEVFRHYQHPPGKVHSVKLLTVLYYLIPTIFIVPWACMIINGLLSLYGLCGSI